MLENRKEKRWEVDLLGLTGRIYDGLGNHRIPFRISDVSEEGIGIVTDVQFPLCSQLLFSIDGSCSGFTHSGVIRWIQEEKNKSFRLGINISPDLILKGFYESTIREAS